MTKTLLGRIQTIGHALIIEEGEGGVRIWEIAKAADVTSASVLVWARRNNLLEGGTHLSSLSLGDSKRALRELKEPDATIKRFDKSTGKGEVTVSTGMGRKDLSFDLKFTRLADHKFAKIRVGDPVKVQLKGGQVAEIRTKKG